MKKILFLLLVIFSFSFLADAQVNLPRPSGYVNDFAGVISSQDKVSLEGLFSELERKTTAQACVVTLDTVAPEAIEAYAVKLFEQWGIGQKGKDNGVLLLVAVKDKSLRIEVGYGLEGGIPDALASQIINEVIVPLFKRGSFSQGIQQGGVVLAGLVAKEYNVELSGLEGVAPVRFQKQKSPVFAFLRLLILFIIIFGFRGGLFPLLFFSSFSRGGDYWGGSSGGFSGGFGGFGGGFSGGGGSSGSW